MGKKNVLCALFEMILFWFIISDSYSYVLQAQTPWSFYSSFRIPVVLSAHGNLTADQSLVLTTPYNSLTPWSFDLRVASRIDLRSDHDSDTLQIAICRPTLTNKSEPVGRNFCFYMQISSDLMDSGDLLGQFDCKFFTPVKLSHPLNNMSFYSLRAASYEDVLQMWVFICEGSSTANSLPDDNHPHFQYVDANLTVIKNVKDYIIKDSQFFVIAVSFLGVYVVGIIGYLFEIYLCRDNVDLFYPKRVIVLWMLRVPFLLANSYDIELIKFVSNVLDLTFWILLYRSVLISCLGWKLTLNRVNGMDIKTVWVLLSYFLFANLILLYWDKELYATKNAPGVYIMRSKLVPFAAFTVMPTMLLMWYLSIYFSKCSISYLNTCALSVHVNLQMQGNIPNTETLLFREEDIFADVATIIREVNRGFLFFCLASTILFSCFGETNLGLILIEFCMLALLLKLKAAFGPIKLQRRIFEYMDQIGTDAANVEANEEGQDHFIYTTAGNRVIPLMIQESKNICKGLSHIPQALETLLICSPGREATILAVNKQSSNY